MKSNELKSVLYKDIKNFISYEVDIRVLQEMKEWEKYFIRYLEREKQREKQNLIREKKKNKKTKS